MAEIKNLSDGLFTKEVDSIYSATESVKDNRLNTGHDYSKDMLTRSISAVLLNNTYLNDFILLIQNALVKFVDAVTQLKVYKNYTVKKDYKKVR
jgi:hypothetical protein